MHVVSTGTVLALVVVVSLFWSRKSLTARVISVGAAVTLVLLRATTLLPMISGDLYQIDLEDRVVSGRTIIRGEDPYTFDMMVYPPTALPLFVGMASVPEPWLQRAWAVLNIAGCLALVPLSSWALWGRSEGHRRLGTLETVLLASVVGFSDSAVTHHVLGQLSVLVSLCLVGVLVLVNSGRSVAAGLLLAVASIKVATMLPFSLVLLRHRWTGIYWRRPRRGRHPEPGDGPARQAPGSLFGDTPQYREAVPARSCERLHLRRHGEYLSRWLEPRSVPRRIAQLTLDPAPRIRSPRRARGLACPAGLAQGPPAGRAVLAGGPVLAHLPLPPHVRPGADGPAADLRDGKRGRVARAFAAALRRRGADHDAVPLLERIRCSS